MLDWEFRETPFLFAAIAIVLVTGAVAVVLLVKLIRKYRQVNRPDTPFPVKFGYYASIAYAIFPVDLLPDPLLIDDIGVLAGALLYVSRVLARVQGERSRRQQPARPPHLRPARQRHRPPEISSPDRRRIPPEGTRHGGL